MAAREKVDKVVVFGGGSFGTAMGVALARQKPELQVRRAWLAALCAQAWKIMTLGGLPLQGNAASWLR